MTRTITAYLASAYRGLARAAAFARAASNNGILSEPPGAHCIEDATKSRRFRSRFLVYAKFRHVWTGTVRRPDRFRLSTVPGFAHPHDCWAVARACGLSHC